MKTKITLYIWALLLIIGGTGTASWFMSKQKYKCDTKAVDITEYQMYVDSTKLLIDSIDYLNNQHRIDRVLLDSVSAKATVSYSRIESDKKRIANEKLDINNVNRIRTGDSLVSRWESYLHRYRN